MGQFDGKVALITGASSGIGQATALAFAREGARVVVADINDAGHETVRRIEAEGGEVRFVATDVTDPGQVERLVVATIQAYGRLDIAFNNAGIAGGEGAPTADYSLSGWNRVIGVNLTGVWLCMKYEIPAMLAGSGGVIVNNASILGLVGIENGCAYVASKHGVVGLTKSAALEYARADIRVNAVCPGYIHTPMVENSLGGDREVEQSIAARHALGRMGEPGEIAGAVLWLASPSASFVTGQAIAIDGGYTTQ